MDLVHLEDPRGTIWLVSAPRTRRERMRGLLGRTGLPDGGAMLFRRCRSVHTLGMRFALDVVFLDGSLRVIDIVSAPPGRRRLHHPRATHVLEAPLGSGLRLGDVLRPQ